MKGLINLKLYAALTNISKSKMWYVGCENLHGFFKVKDKKKPRNPYRNRKKSAGTEKPYLNFVRRLVVNWYIPLLKRWCDILGIEY